MTGSLNSESNTNFGAGGYVPKVDFLTREQEKDLWRRWIDHDDMAARAIFLKAYLPLCKSLAWEQVKLQRNKSDLMHDLFGEAECELVEVFDKKAFDPDMGNRFSTYVTPWIRSRLINYTMDNKAPFRMCTTALHRKIFNNHHALETKVLRDNPQMSNHQRHQAIADLLGVYRDKKVEAADIAEYEIKLSSVRISGSSNMFDDDDGGESIISRTVSDLPAPESCLEDEDADRAKQLLFNAMGKLAPRSKNIIEQRYLAPETSTLQDLAAIYGVSAERIRQIENASLKILFKAITEGSLPARPLIQRRAPNLV